VALFDGQYGRPWAMLRSACGRLIWIKARNFNDLIGTEVCFRSRLIWINDGLGCDASRAIKAARIRTSFAGLMFRDGASRLLT